MELTIQTDTLTIKLCSTRDTSQQTYQHHQ